MDLRNSFDFMHQLVMIPEQMMKIRDVTDYVYLIVIEFYSDYCADLEYLPLIIKKQMSSFIHHSNLYKSNTYLIKGQSNELRAAFKARKIAT